MAEERSDVIVVGHGIAGLATAVSALEQGLSVTLLERAPVEERGGNTRWTEAFMRMKNEAEVSDDFESHFMANAGHHLDPGLINHTADPYEAWPSIVKALSFTDPEVVGTLAAEAGPTLSWLKGLPSAVPCTSTMPPEPVMTKFASASALESSA